LRAHKFRIFEYTYDVPQSELRIFKAGIFQALAHPTRIAIIDELRSGELNAGALAERLGVEQANLSQHLAVLRARHVVLNRRVANQVLYSVRDAVLFQVLDLLRQYFVSQAEETRTMLAALDGNEGA
jgi:DNA-binding transcriptional ArsR family regulator